MRKWGVGFLYTSDRKTNLRNGETNLRNVKRNLRTGKTNLRLEEVKERRIGVVEYWSDGDGGDMVQRRGSPLPRTVPTGKSQAVRRLDSWRVALLRELWQDAVKRELGPPIRGMPEEQRGWTRAMHIC